MRITDMIIDGYGLFNDSRLHNLPSGLVLFLGDNEAGKTSLLAFIRAILFGIPNTKSPDYLDSLAGSVHGGKIILQLSDSRLITVARSKTKKTRTLTVTGPTGTLLSEQELNKTLGVSKAVYNSVFAISLSELNAFSSLSDSAVSDALFAGTAGVAALKFPQTMQTIKAKYDALFRPKGATQPIALKLRELKDVHSKLTAATAQSKQYDAKAQELAELKSLISKKTDMDEALTDSIDRAELHLRLLPDWHALRTAESELATLPEHVDSFPHQGMNTLELERTSIRDATLRLQSVQADIAETTNTASLLHIDPLLQTAEHNVAELSAGLALFQTKVQDREATTHELWVCQHRIDAELARLGRDWTEDRVLQVDLALFTTQAIRNHIAHLSAIEAELALLTSEISTIRHDLDIQEAQICGIRQHIEALGTPDEPPDPEAYNSLVASRTQFDSVVDDLPAQSNGLHSAEILLQTEIEDIDPGWSQDNLSTFDTSATAYQKLSSLQIQLRELSASVHDTEQQIRSEERLLAQDQSRIQRLQDTLASCTPQEVNSPEEAHQRQQVLRQARNTNTQYATACQARVLQVQSRTDLESRCASEMPSPMKWVTVSLAASILTALVTVCFGAWMLYQTGHLPSFPNSVPLPALLPTGISVCVGGLLLCLCFLAVYLLGRAQRRRAHETYERLLEHTLEAGRRTQEAETLTQDLEDQLRTLCASLGIHSCPVTDALLDVAEDQLHADILTLQRRDAYRSEVTDISETQIRPRETLLEELRQTLATFQQSLSDENARWIITSQQIGFVTVPDNPQAALHLFEKVLAAKQRLEAVNDLEDRVRRMRETANRYMSLASRIPGLPEQTAEPNLRRFLSAVDSFVQHETRQKDLRADIARLSHMLNTQTASLNSLNTRLTTKISREQELLLQKETYLQETWAPWLSSHGFPADLSPETALDALAVVDRCTTAIQDKQSIQDLLDRLQDAICAYTSTIAVVATAVEQPPPAEADIVSFVNDVSNRCAQDNISRQKLAEHNNTLSRLSRTAERELNFIAEAEARLADLYAHAGVGTEDAFVARASLFEQQKALEGKIASCAHNLRNIAQQTDLSPLREALSSVSRESLERDIAGYQEQKEVNANALTPLKETERRLANELDGLKSSADIEELTAHKAALLAELEDLALEWARWRTAQHLLDQARKHFEQERQPPVIQAASEYFAQMTRGAYLQIVQDLGENSICVIDASYNRKNPDQLSRGTREQLFLALRMGYISRLYSDTDCLPVVLDDVLVNFDPGRALSTAHVLASLADAGRQVLAFTCHPETVSMFAAVAPSATVIPIRDYSFGNPVTGSAFRATSVI